MSSPGEESQRTSPIDTGWINDELRASLAAASPLGRVGQPRHNRCPWVSFLSPQRGWINDQLLRSDSDLHT